MIILGVDLGSRRVGFALCDPEETIASPHAVRVLRAGSSARQVAALVIEEAARTRAELVIIGNPVHMSGRQSPNSLFSQEVAREIAGAGLKTRLWDERLTTSEAERALKEQGLSRRQRAARVDAVAAQRILAGFLDCRQRGKIPDTTLDTGES